MRRNVVIGLIALVIIAGIIYWYRRTSQTELPPSPEPTFEETFENKFNIQVPDDVDKAQLRDVSGGDASGLATRIYEGGAFSHAVLADLLDPASGYFYEGWLVRGKGSMWSSNGTGSFRETPRSPWPVSWRTTSKDYFEY